MSTTPLKPKPDPQTADLTGALSALFFLSGCAALIYEVVWLHLLRLVVGASAASVGILLACFMGGMFVGSLVYARLVLPGRHPLRVYALLEAGIGAIGLLLPFVLPRVTEVYVAFFGYGVWGVVLRAVIASLCILPPTILMGATFPAVSRWFASTSEGFSRLGLLYAANIVGAVAGALLAGFYLLPAHGVMIATYAAIALNAGAASAAWLLARTRAYEPRVQPQTPTAPARGDWAVYTVIGLSGMTALGAQVVWTRLLSMLLGLTSYTFSIILAVFLGGLGIGSAAASVLIRRGKDPRALLGWSQLLLIPSLAYSAYMITHVVPYLASNRFLPISLIHWNEVLRCTVAILPGTILWGASFPLALACVGKGVSDTGRTSGRTYAANTVGAIVGALGFSLLAIPLWGTRGSQRAFLLLAGVAAVLISLVRGRRTPSQAQGAGREAAGARRRLASNPLLVASLAPALVLAGAWTISAPPDAMVTYGRNIEKWKITGDVPYREEGMVSTVAVQARDDGTVYLHVGGEVVATTELEDMRLQRMLGHLPALVHDDPRSVLIVGLGAGVTSGSFVVYPEIRRIVICEIERSVYGAAFRYFAEANHHVLEDPRVEVIFDDARHFLATTKETFDIITSDPIHPWVHDSATLYSREFYRLVKAHLNPGGVATQWVPFYEADELAVKIQIRTFMEAFPNGTIWSADVTNVGTDAVLLGRPEPLQIDVNRAEARVLRNPRLRQSLAGAQMNSILALFATYGGSDSDLEAWLANAPVNEDLSMKLEYVAGLALNKQMATRIYGAIKARRTFPEDLFIAPPAVLRILKGLIARS